VTERLADFVHALEWTLPSFFAGAVQAMQSGNSHVKRTVCKRPVTPETVVKLQESTVWQMEQHFYEFAKAQFENTFARIQAMHGASDLHYEKIRPRQDELWVDGREKFRNVDSIVDV
jgi:heparan sulfate 2-O-sulfotransferase HS2ST1